jgi:hypothetical protein
MSLHFNDYKTGDIVSVIYHGAQCALVKLSEIKDWSMKGYDGEEECKITKVGISSELRFYATIGPNRQSVLRYVKLVKVEN